MRVRLLLAAVAAFCLSGSALAQPLPQLPPATEGEGWLTGYNFHTGIDALSGDDSRFQWDFDVGGDVDLLRMGPGRINFLLNYEALLGEQFQRFDPIFNNYSIDTLGGFTRGRVEWAVRFHHLSRHLGDRPKNFGIAWNAIGPQVAWRPVQGRTDVQVRGWFLGVIALYSVDYDAEFGGDLIAMRSLNQKVAVVARASIQGFLIDPERSTREEQFGGRVEGAVRLSGPGAAAELYVAVDRRVDADPLENRPVTWALVGLRLLNK
jgi:hypothetical protein